MDGVFGVIRRDGARLDAAELERLTGPLAETGGAAFRAELGAIYAQGWARSVHDTSGVHVAGEAHLTNRAELAAASGVTTPLEIVAALYRVHGPEALARLHGEFCLAILDTRAEQLVLATDRFATRPVYYAEQADRVVFGTSLDRVAAQVERTIDHQAILEYLVYTVVPAPRTPFTAVRKVPAGHMLVAKRSGIGVHPYWDMAYPESRNGNVASWARQLRAQIEGAVRRYLAAEESGSKIGAFLSGGTDSSTVAGMIGAITGQPTKTFSIGYVEQGYDELPYADIAARWFRTQQYEWRLSAGEALDALPAIVAYYEEPFGNASVLPAYRCALLAREHGVSVLFAGDGGDELFGGNERYRTDRIFGLYQRVPALLRRGLTDPLIGIFPDGWPVLGRARRYVRRSSIANPRRFFSYDLLLSEPLGDLLAPEFLAAVKPEQLLSTAEAHYHRPAAGTTELNRLLYLDLKLVEADNDIRKVNGMAELAGVQVRYPLLDTELVEFSGQIPARLKLRGLEKRYIFKRALADFLPPEILKKPKHGFGAPIAVWMKSDPRWRTFVGDILHDSSTRQRGYLRISVLDNLWRQLHADGASYYGDTLWPTLMLELWHRRRADGQVSHTLLGGGPRLSSPQRARPSNGASCDGR